jgi:hypothetical protein
MNPTLTELIESAMRSAGRVEAILDRMEAREAVMEAILAEDPAPGHPELPIKTNPQAPTK